MDFFPPEFWSALLAIVITDLVLAGDNAIVIGLAARNVPLEKQKKVIFWGTFGAIAVRTLMTLVVVWLLKIPGLLLIGGILLIWIAFKLLVEEKQHGEMKSGGSFWSAIKTIIIADAVMGLDNVLAVAGAAHGNFVLVVLGLLISVPIVVWGSTIILKWVERYPVIIYIGAGVLAWTASKMITGEAFLKGFFADNLVLKWGLSIVLIAGVLFTGRIMKQKKEQATS
ncbi:integral membrane protein, YjbE family [Syntrophobotulus glycolicus DSM 8271]|uniref:Integral membrane protein, YjbE family n=1 Tax=Syntrophobotulus glycolicus (strain DSM 8271 / FlGlyR) TaxID=645991 RepID=F0T1P0_SYNGF|nr:TerC family protein [Syntrophobotulus glycolicus]ADY57464.1 integral membrane protein, YjbE family [Syntrophobotulus glycolicus DSM 8271]